MNTDAFETLIGVGRDVAALLLADGAVVPQLEGVGTTVGWGGPESDEILLSLDELGALCRTVGLAIEFEDKFPDAA